MNGERAGPRGATGAAMAGNGAVNNDSRPPHGTRWILSASLRFTRGLERHRGDLFGRLRHGEGVDYFVEDIPSRRTTYDDKSHILEKDINILTIET